MAMEWIVIGHTGEECEFVSEHEKRFFAYLLEVALDFFLTSAYTYNDAEGNHIGWLVSDMYVD